MVFLLGMQINELFFEVRKTESPKDFLFPFVILNNVKDLLRRIGIELTFRFKKILRFTQDDK
jgi:hypothetical protein